MLWNKRKIQCEKEIQEEICSLVDKIYLWEQIVKELENVYYPVRDKCEEAIRSHGLNHYPLSDVIELRIEKSEDIYEIVIYDLKEDWWNGERRLKKTDILLDEKFQLCAASSLNEFAYNYLNNAISHLEIPNKFFSNGISTMRDSLLYNYGATYKKN